MLSPEDYQALQRYYLQEAKKFYPFTQYKLLTLMPWLEKKAKINLRARRLFNEICFSGIFPQYENKWCPEINVLAM